MRTEHSCNSQVCIPLDFPRAWEGPRSKYYFELKTHVLILSIPADSQRVSERGIEHVVVILAISSGGWILVYSHSQTLM
jgi:hypothetical protein